MKSRDCQQLIDEQRQLQVLTQDMLESLVSDFCEWIECIFVIGTLYIELYYTLCLLSSKAIIIIVYYIPSIIVTVLNKRCPIKLIVKFGANIDECGYIGLANTWSVCKVSSWISQRRLLYLFTVHRFQLGVHNEKTINRGEYPTQHDIVTCMHAWSHYCHEDRCKYYEARSYQFHGSVFNIPLGNYTPIKIKDFPDEWCNVM